MNLPNASAAIVSKAKVDEYLLDPLHPDGRSKVRFFTAMGFSRGRWNDLAETLRGLAQTAPVANTVESVHGTKYFIEGLIVGPKGNAATVRTIWIVDAGNDIPRLVTAYPHEFGDEQ